MSGHRCGPGCVGGHSGEQKTVAVSDPSNERREVVYNLPPRNPSFVGRDIQLAAFENGLEERTSTVVQVLHGIGGVGKTTLSTEYAGSGSRCSGRSIRRR